MTTDSSTLDLDLTPKSGANSKSCQTGKQVGPVSNQDGQDRLAGSSKQVGCQTGQIDRTEQTSSDHSTSDSDTDSDTNQMFANPKPGPSKKIINFY